MELLDIHTHKPSLRAILNESPLDFLPCEGQFYSLGIHPWRVKEDYGQEWEALCQWAPHPQVLAIGETGLDKTVPADWALQKELFDRQIALARQVGKPLVIHCVKSSNEVIGEKRKQLSAVPWIIHGFRGNKELAAQFIRHGFYLSFGERYQEEALKSVPLERMFIETDESGVDIRELYCRAALLVDIPEEEFTEKICRNIAAVFQGR